MLNFLFDLLPFDTSSFSKKKKKRRNFSQKLFLTLFFLFLFRFGNSLPLTGIDQEALQKSLQSFPKATNFFNLYSSGENQVLSFFSLGIGPFINASILVDLLTAVFPPLEALQSEEGQSGRQKLFFYKKLATLGFSIIQAIFLLRSVQVYLYDLSFFSFSFLGLQLVTGSMMIVWLSTLIEKQEISNGTSLILFSNIMLPLVEKTSFFDPNHLFFSLAQLFFFLVFLVFICLSQTAKFNIEVVSARQLAFLQKKKQDLWFLPLKKKEKGLSIKYNQAGIFPIIIATNVLALLGNFSLSLPPFLSTLLYAGFLLLFNYFYTLLFWDPEKISEQLRKASVSLVNISPGKETVSYLENVVKSTSLIGGLFLCSVLVFYNILQGFFPNSFFSQLMISSFIIVVGVAYECQKSVRSLLLASRQENPF
jgi:preprotein translocase subunit SecY